MSNPITDYDTLQAAVADWLNRADMTSVIPYLIFFAEVTLNRRKRIFAMETVQYVQTTAESKWLSYPSGYKGFRWLRRNISTQGGRLDYVTSDVMNKTSRYHSLGEPEVYTLHGDRIQLGPVPNAVIELEAGVYEDVPYLSDANTSNWWLANVPDALLYGALMHAEPYLKNDARVQVWSGMYERASEDIDMLDEQYRYPQGSLVQRLA